MERTRIHTERHPQTLKRAQETGELSEIHTGTKIQGHSHGHREK